jgi:hypothetical protein
VVGSPCLSYIRSFPSRLRRAGSVPTVPVTIMIMIITIVVVMSRGTSLHPFPPHFHFHFHFNFYFYFLCSSHLSKMIQAMKENSRKSGYTASPLRASGTLPPMKGTPAQLDHASATASNNTRGSIPWMKTHRRATKARGKMQYPIKDSEPKAAMRPPKRVTFRVRTTAPNTATPKTNAKTYTMIHMTERYIYMCVCVCVCDCGRWEMGGSDRVYGLMMDQMDHAQDR